MKRQMLIAWLCALVLLAFFCLSAAALFKTILLRLLIMAF